MFFLENTGLGPSFQTTFGVPAEKFCDKLITFATKKFKLDILAFDEWLGTNDPEYKPDKCTYKGKKGYSMREYVKERYGDSAVSIVDALL